MAVLLKFLREIINPWRVLNKQKYFCIGHNKTGTTSLKRAFKDLGFTIGDQRRAERLLPNYLRNDFDSIINYCRYAQVFQDFPFSYPETFKHLDKAFPNSKFILSVRDSPEHWYNSITRFHTKKFGNGKLPTKQDLQNSNYINKGWAWESFRAMYDTPEDDLYNREMLIEAYKHHNNTIIDYFHSRPDDLIVLNLSDEGSYQQLMGFLNIASPHKDFPWENRTQTIL